MPKKAGRHTHDVGELARLERADVRVDAEGARGVDGVFGDVALDALVVADARPSPSAAGRAGPSSSQASCQVRQITSWMRPMPWLSEPSMEIAPMSCSTSSAAMVCARMRLSAKATSSGIAGLR